MVLSQEEISALLEPISEYTDEYARYAVWEHKDGGVYEVIKKVPFVLYEAIDDSLCISRNISLVWYRERFADKLNDSVYVRTQEHFEKAFKHIPAVNLI